MWFRGSLGLSLIKFRKFSGIRKFKSLVMSRESGLENTRTGFSSLEIFQEPDVREHEVK